MLRDLLRALARRCEVHDVATPGRTHELEQELGLSRSDLLGARLTHLLAEFYDPDLIDCGRQWCRRRRGLA